MTRTAQSQWLRLTTEQQQKTITAYLKSIEATGLSKEAVAEISSCLGFRPNMVKNAQSEQLVRLIQKTIAQGSNRLARLLLEVCEEDISIPTDSLIPPSPADTLGLDHQSGMDTESTFDNNPELTHPFFSSLDKVLVRAVISSLNDTPGALDEDELDDLIQETVELNDTRAQSNFHRGFLDSLLGRECQEMSAGENSTRRAWYLVGFCLGLMRNLDAAAGAAFIASLESKDKHVLLSPPVQAGVFVIPFLIRPLLDKHYFNDAAQWIESYLATTAEHVIPRIVKWARMALLDKDPGHITRILELCVSKIGDIPNSQSKDVAPLANKLERRLAIGLRLQGKVTQAETMIDRLLDDEPKPSARSKLLGDKLLIRMGMRSLEDLRIRKLETREALGATLLGVKHIWEDAFAGSAAASPATELAAAIHVVLSGSDSAEILNPAILGLNRAIRSMETKHLKFWTEKGVLPRAKFYLSVLELRLLDPASGAPALTRLIQLLEDGLKEPLDLVVNTVEHAVAQDLADSDRLAKLALRKWPQAVLSELELKGLVRRSSPVRNQIVDALEENKERLNAQERWRAWQDVLQGSLRADERDIEVAQRALDELELLAESQGFEQEFTDLLQLPENWDPAWTPMEAATARFRILEATGRVVDARAALVTIAHSAISERADDAFELIEQLKLLGAGQETVADLENRLNAALPDDETPQTETPTSKEPVSVLFIGGNEKQASYVEGIKSALRESHPMCEVHFEIPGWSSNWGREIDKYKRAMENSDTVVLMRFIRTNLGRHLRKASSETDTPWIPCTGHGQQSMLRAITKAINVARQSKLATSTSTLQPDS